MTASENHRRQAILWTLSCACGRSECRWLPVAGREVRASPLILKVGQVLPAGHPTSRAMAFFEQRVETLTDGRIDVRLYASGQVGNTNQLIMLSQMGNLEACVVSGRTAGSVCRAAERIGDALHLSRCASTSMRLSMGRWVTQLQQYLRAAAVDRSSFLRFRIAQRDDDAGADPRRRRICRA